MQQMEERNCVHQKHSMGFPMVDWSTNFSQFGGRVEGGESLFSIPTWVLIKVQWQNPLYICYLHPSSCGALQEVTIKEAAWEASPLTKRAKPITSPHKRNRLQHAEKDQKGNAADTLWLLQQVGMNDNYLASKKKKKTLDTILFSIITNYKIIANGKQEAS